VSEFLEGVEQCFAFLHIRCGHFAVPIDELGGVIGNSLALCVKNPDFILI
jgi:hypothetical protein